MFDILMLLSSIICNNQALIFSTYVCSYNINYDIKCMGNLVFRA